MKRKIGINADSFRGGDVYESLKKIKAHGFNCFFVEGYSSDFIGYKKLADELGLTFDFIHAPFRGINDFWLEGDGYKELYEKICLSIETAAACSVPVVITHLSSGWQPPAVSEIGLSRFDALVEIAEQRGIILAFENLRNYENIMVIMERYKDRKNVRFCYDCGHEYCYTHGVDWIKIFGEKLICTHIHDNLGYDRTCDPDIHILPFDGTLDYADMVRRLDKVGYEGPIMLEVFNTTKSEYKELTADEFFATCAARAKRIAEM